MGCCASCCESERETLVIVVEDGSTRTINLVDLPLFAGSDTSTDFLMKANLKSGPLVSFGVQRSPSGLKPFLQPDIAKLLKPLRKFDLFHGGEQLLFVAWCTVNAPGTAELGGKARIVVLTSLGRLYCVHPGAKVTATCSATQVSHAMLQGSALELRFYDQRSQWVVSSSYDAVANLQRVLWVISSVAHSHLLMQTNMRQLPLELLPPLAIDGNLHSAYTIFAHAHDLAREGAAVARRAHSRSLSEHEDVLRSPDAKTTPALQCIRQWMLRMEVAACNPTCPRMQPHVSQPATPCIPADNPMHPSLQPYASQPATLWRWTSPSGGPSALPRSLSRCATTWSKCPSKQCPSSAPAPR